MKTSSPHSSPRPTPPSHLVAFHPDEADPGATLRHTLKGLGKAVATPGVRASAVHRLAPRTKSSAPVTIFQKLKVAALDLDAGEIESLRRKGCSIVRNRRRYALERPRRLLPVRIRGHEVGPPPPGSPGFDSHIEGLLPVGTGTPENWIEYLHGQRDLIETLLRRFGPVAPSPVLIGPEPAELETESAKHLGWPLRMMRIREDSPKGKGVRVAVLDTGLDLKHPDFAEAGRIAPDRCLNLIDESKSVQDGEGHGTHCCGIVAGPANPGQGPRYGVAPGVELLVGKVLDDEGSGYDSDILEGLAWAADLGARVVSLSLGSARRAFEPYSQVYEDAARNLEAQGHQVLVVAAAGNESDLPNAPAAVGDPAACPSFMAVGAVDRRLRLARFSCVQLDSLGLVDVVAPGVGIRSSYPVDKGSYAEMDGTSMATPHVAGLAALILELHPQYTSSQLWDALQQSCQPLGRPDYFGRGLARLP